MTTPFGVRTYEVITRTGERALVIALVVDGREVLRWPGNWVRPLRVTLQQLEADHPTLVGDDPGAVVGVPEEMILPGNGGETKH